MAKNVTIAGSNYNAVPSVQIPLQGGGTAEFYDSYSIEYSMTGAYSTVTPDKVIASKGLALKLKPSTGYDLVDVTVTMGGDDITSEVFSFDSGSGGGGSDPNLGTKSISSNGTYTATDDGYDGYSSVTVSVSGSSPNLQAKTNISPTTSSQTITADNGYDGLSSVQINAMPSGTAGTPTATKGSVSNHSISVTPSVTNTTGYITGSTKTGTAVSVSASELVSGNKEITANGTNIDVANYSTVSVSVSASGKTTYTYMGLASRTANSYGATNAKVTVSKAGTYNISYVAIRGSSSGTMGTNLYIGSSGKGNVTTWNNGTYGQYTSYTSQSISANTDVTIYATSGNNSRTIYVGNLIVQEV